MIRSRVALKHAIKFGILGLVLTTVGFALAQSKSNKAIKYRQSVMSVVGWNFYPIVAMTKGKIPYDAKVFARNAQRVSIMLPMAAEGFTKGSDVGKTSAKPEIWSNMDDFKMILEDATNAVTKLAEFSKAGDAAAMKEQLNTANKACNSCHKKYRKKTKK